MSNQNEQANQIIPLLGPKGLPVRPSTRDCAFYVRTGRCDFGSECKFNHPQQIADHPSETCFGPTGLPIQPSEWNCGFYMQHGNCKYRKACKWNHPPEIIDRLRKEFPHTKMGTHGMPVRPGTRPCFALEQNGSCHMGMRCEFDHPFPPGAKGGVLPSNTKGRRQDSDHQQNTVYPNSATKLKDGRWAAAPSTQLQILESDAEDSDYQQNTVYPNSATKLKDGRWAAAPPSQLQVLESEAEGWQVVGRGGSYKSEAGLLSKEGELLRGEINHQNGYSKVMAAEDNDSTDSMLLTESRKNDYASMGFKEEMIIRAAEQEDPNNIDGMVELLVKLQAAEETVHETSHESKHDPASIMTHDSSKRSWSNHQSNSSSTHQQKDFNSEVVSRKRDNPVPAGAPSPLPPSPPPDWRAQLRAGHLVDARDADGRWFESVVVEAKRGSKLKIHFKGWNAKWDTYIDANSEDIQPLFTHTPKWRDLLKVGDTLEVCEPREFPNPLENTVGPSPRWFEGTVLQLDRQGQKVLVRAVAGSVPAKWVDLRGEEICAPGTHIKALVGRQRAAPTPSLPVHMRPGFVPTQQCKYFPFGRCQKGASCTFIHDTNNANSKVNPPLGASSRSTRQEMGALQNLTKEGEDTSRQREEEEASKRSSGEESVRLAEAAQKRAKIEALRRKEEEDAAKRREAEQAARIEAEAAKRRAEQEAARRSAEEAARIEAEVEAEKRRAEKEEARRNAEEAARIEAEAEAARRRRAEKEAERRNAEEAARIEAELQTARAEKEAARTAEQKKTEQKRAQTTAHRQAQAQAEDEASDSVFQKLQQKEGPLLDEYGIESLDDFSELTANDWKDVSLRMKVINFRRLRKHLGLTPELPSYQEGGPKENGAESLKDVMSIRGNEGLGGNRKAETVSKQRSSSSPRKKGMSNSASTQINAKGSVQQQKQEQKQAPAQDSDALGGTGGERPCSICNKDTFLKCRLCKEARFCSRECQVKGWKMHKKVCKGRN